LKEIIRGWDTKKLREFSAEKGMQWKRMCGSISEELQTSPKESYWRTGINAL